MERLNDKSDKVTKENPGRGHSYVASNIYLIDAVVEDLHLSYKAAQISTKEQLIA